MDKFILIDGHAIIHRAFHAFPDTLRTADGEQVNAVYGFTSILLEVLDQFKPKYVICAFDTKGPTQRHDMYTGYKENRSTPDDALISQIPRILEVVEAFNIPIFKLAGFEADDILGTIVTQERTESIHKIIVTGDQDIFQLVDDQVSVYISGSKFSKAKLYDTKGVEEKFGFGPDYIIDYKALRGDPSDNIPGVKGIGDKGAKSLIADYGHLDSILENVENITSKSTKNKLIDQADMAELSRKLATIIKDVPITFKLKDSILTDFDYNKVKDMFIQLQFRSLMNKIPKPDGLPDEESIQSEAESETKSVILKTKKEILDFLVTLSKQNKFAFDTETTGLDQIDSEVLGISFSFKEGEGYYLDLHNGEIDDEVISMLKKIFEDKKVEKIAHNFKFDAHMLRNSTTKGQKLDINIRNYYFDTLVAAYVLKGGSGKIGLKSLAFEKFGINMTNLEDVWKKIPGFKSKKNYKLEEVKQFMIECDHNLLGKYACADADVTLRLYNELSKELDKKPDLKKLFFDIEMPMIEILVDIERNGISLDSEYLAKFGVELDERLGKIKEDIFYHVGHEFNVASPKQVGEVLFDELGLPGGKKTKTGAWQTNERILKDLADVSPVVKSILEYRELAKLRSTYVQPLIDQVNPKTERIHTHFNQTIVTTGRLSSSNPNLQNIPVASEVGQKIRQAFVAKPGYKLTAFDVSQQELRILAHMSEDPSLIEGYKKGMDIHTLTASKLFKVDPEKVTKDQRGKGKTLNFSLIYGISAFGLSARMKIDRAEAQDLIDNYFKVYPKVKEFFDGLLAQAKDNGAVTTMFGRYRDTSGLSSSNFAVRGATEREVINFPIQGTAADMIKIAMADCQKFITKDKLAKELDAKMILQVHDELIFEVKEINAFDEKVDKFGKDVIKIMEDAVKLKVPVKVDMNVSDNWAGLK